MTNVPLQRSLTPGRIAQLEERGPYKAEVPGSIPGPPTTPRALARTPTPLRRTRIRVLRSPSGALRAKGPIGPGSRARPRSWSGSKSGIFGRVLSPKQLGTTLAHSRAHLQQGAAGSFASSCEEPEWFAR